MISFEFTPTKADYVQTYQAFYLTKWPQLVAVLLAGAFFGATALALSFSRDTQSRYLAFVPAFFCVAIFFVAIYTFSVRPNIAAKQVEKNERLVSLTRYEISDENITIKNQFAESKVDWGTFSRVVETKSYFLLVHSVTNRTFHFVPKRAFPNIDSQQNFRQILSSKLPLAPKRSFDLKANPVAMIVIILILGCCIFSFVFNLFALFVNSQ